MSLAVFTGGARSGKSSAAQELAVRRSVDADQQVVVAVFARNDAADSEFADRVVQHKANRPDGFVTLEADGACGWLDSVPVQDLLVIDCLGTLLGRIMEDAWTAPGALGDAEADTLPSGYAELVEARLAAIVERIIDSGRDCIVVTNEVGDGVVPEWASGRLFRDALGRANRRLVGAADVAYLCVAGRLVHLSALPQLATWPED